MDFKDMQEKIEESYSDIISHYHELKNSDKVFIKGVLATLYGEGWLNKIKEKKEERINIIKESKPKSKIKIPEGSSCLLILREKGEIRICRRSSNVSTKDKVCISDDVKEYFFAQFRDLNICKRKYYSIYKKENPSIYSKWEKWLTKEFNRQIGEKDD